MIWGLVILYTFTFIGLLIAANEHGKPKKGKNNFWLVLVAWILQLTLIWWALGWRFW